MVYPVLLLFVAAAVMIAMLGFVLPRFEGLFKTLGTPLPSATRVLMEASGFVREWWFLLIGAVILGGVAARLALATPKGGLALSSFLRRVPKVGSLKRSIATARISRVMGVLLSGRVAMIDSLRLLRQSAPGPEYAALLQNAEELVMRGESLSAAFSDERLIVPGACEALKSGERSGRIGPVLMQVADSLDEENELAVKTVSGLIEPVILIVMGLLVGGVAISMFLPLFDLAAAGGGAAP
jgi:type II secretory pathway component PulF